MKIILVTEATSSGVGRHVMDIASYLSDLGEDVYIIHSLNRADSIYKKRLLIIQSKIKDAFCVPMQRSISPIKDIVSFSKIYTYFSKMDRLDVVHVHSSKSGILGSLAAKLNHAKCIIFTPHAFASMGSTGVKKQFLLVLERVCGFLCDYLVAVSIDEADYALKNKIVPEKKICLIRNGVEVPPLNGTENKRQEFRSQIGISDTTRLIGSIGRITFQKHPMLFIDLVHLRSKKYNPSEEKYVMIGNGDLTFQIKTKIKELKLEDHILFMGFQDDVSTIFLGLDIYVLHSRYEGMPYTLLEAMSYGLPVISTKVPGVQELISNKELIVDPGDLHALDEALDRMTFAEYRNVVGRLNRKFLAENFTCEVMCNKLMDLYTSASIQK
jgi:glycosyltransferase involved in cell wall biosynthesis